MGSTLFGTKTTRIFLISLASIALQWFFFGDMLSQLDTVILGQGEDGIKNLYTVDYHVRHDSTSLWFEGMNYPYGEHVVFTDNQPLVSNCLRAFNGLISIENGLPQILQSLPFLGIVLASVLLLLVFRELETDKRLSFWAALALPLIHPQFARIFGHYSLSYVFMIPAVLLLSIRFVKYESWRQALAIVVVIVLSFFFHPYYLAFDIATIILFYFFFYWKQFKLLSLQRWLKLGVQIVLPIAFTSLFMGTTDPVSDRPESPYGMLVYVASLPSLFLPTEYPVFDGFLGTLGLDYSSEEGSYFIGYFLLMSTIGGLLLLRVNNHRQARKASESQSMIKSIGLTALVLLFVCTAIPIAWGPFESLTKFLGPLQQFRGLGRFAFCFFFLISIWAVWMVSIWIQSVDNAKAVKAAYTLGLVLLVADLVSFAQNRIVAKFEMQRENPVNNYLIRLLPEINWSSYQAILPIPSFHIGSEQFRTVGEMPLLNETFRISRISGLPTTGAVLSRTSLSQTVSRMQLSLLPLEIPPILETFPSDKPLLVLTKADLPLSGTEKMIVASAKLIGQYSDYKLHALELSKYAYIQEQLTKGATIACGDSSTIKVSKAESFGDFYKSYDSENDATALAGSGAQKAQGSEATYLIGADQALTAGQWECSFYFKIDEGVPNLQLWHYTKTAADSILSFQLSEIGDHVIGIRDDWALFAYEFNVENVGEKHELFVYRQGSKALFFMDELLVRKKANIYCSDTEPLMINNRYFSSKSNNQ